MEQDRYSFEEADYAFGGINSVSEEFRVVLANALTKLPKDIVDWVGDSAFFVSSSNEYYALTLPIQEFEHKKGFIFLSETLKEETEEIQLFHITHEIAHLKLNHQSSILSNLSIRETKRQEIEADNLAKTWIKQKEI